MFILQKKGKKFAWKEHEDAIRHFEYILQDIGQEDSYHLVRIIKRITKQLEEQSGN